MKNLGSLKREILRFAQNDKDCRFFAHWRKASRSLSEGAHKIFDNKFFLKYIQQLGLRKISHFHDSHQWAFAPPIKQEKRWGFIKPFGVYSLLTKP